MFLCADAKKTDPLSDRSNEKAEKGGNFLAKDASKLLVSCSPAASRAYACHLDCTVTRVLLHIGRWGLYYATQLRSAPFHNHKYHRTTTAS